jgi:CBS domain containing-hemolysin-like protein
MTTALILLGVAALLVLGNGVFVAAETALVTVDRNLVESRAGAGEPRFQRVAAALHRLSTYLSGAQLGITLTSLAIGFVAEPSVATLLHPLLVRLGLSAAESRVIGVAVALLIATAVQMVFGELVPKNIALSRPVGMALRVIFPLVVFTQMARPLIALLNGAANRLVRLAGVQPVEELRSARTPDELGWVVRNAAHEGALETETAGLLERSLTFGEKTAADVMTPRTRLHTVRASASAAAVIVATCATGHSRFPVIGDDIDDVRGVVHVKQAVVIPHPRRAVTAVQEMMTSPLVVPWFLRLDPLLDLMQGEDRRLVIVLDEYGGTAGIVTHEDLVEELVGDVVDEHDIPAPGIRSQPDGSWIVSGLLRPDEVNAAINVDLPEGDEYETIAGLILQALGRLPDVGDEVQLPTATLAVERLDGRRIDRIRITGPRLEPDAEQDADGNEAKS